MKYIVKPIGRILMAIFVGLYQPCKIVLFVIWNLRMPTIAEIAFKSFIHIDYKDGTGWHKKYLCYYNTPLDALIDNNLNEFYTQQERILESTRNASRKSSSRSY